MDLKGGWLNYPRPKTEIARRIPLWPETVKALRVVMKNRPEPKSPEHAPYVFITKYGGTWFKETSDNPVSKEFAKLLKDTDLKRDGLNFYALRHTFETIGGDSRDQVAVNAIMGHAPESNDMSAVYRESVSDERLQAVVDHVRGWLYAEPAEDDSEPATTSKPPAARTKNVKATTSGKVKAKGATVLKLFVG